MLVRSSDIKMIKGKLPPWISVNGEHPDIQSFHSFRRPLFGFVYALKYEDGKIYIGKKNFYSIRKLPRLQNRQTREGHLNFRGNIETIIKESKWKTYIGSNEQCKKRKPVKRIILSLAYDKKHLTYLEAEALFTNKVLLNKDFINDNILGKFFRKDFLKYESNPS